MNIKNQPAIVTGAASGMGAATAKALAEQGAIVALLDKNAKAVEATAEQTGGTPFECDVTDERQVQSVLEAAKAKHGSPRICINCAGIAPAARIVGKKGPHPLDTFNQVIQINLIGTFNLMRLVAAQMMENDPQGEDNSRGIIINTASVAAFEGQIGQAAYSASKGGVVAMTLPAAREFANFGIRVNTIAPGLIATPMLLNMPQAVQDSLSATVPYPKRLGKPEEFASLATHIIENDLINGEVIRLDGAIRMAAK